MQIEMKQTAQGSPNGIVVRVYEKGKKYTVPSQIPLSLAKVFIDQKWATEVEEEPPENDPDQGNEGGNENDAGNQDDKDQGAPDENKDAGASPENKQAGQKKKD